MSRNEDAGRLQADILEAVAASPELLTFRKLEKILLNRLEIRRDDLKRAVDALVTEGELVYSYKHGCSFLEKSFEKPVRVSKRIVLVPCRIAFSGGPEDVVIRMQSGISFGRGDHPTTRLGLRGVEHVFEDTAFSGSRGINSTVLDIGTGSGILAIACVLFGAGRATGIDTDPCARKEAVENAGINGLGKRIEISDMPVEKIKGQFSIITANLRCPTLISLYPLMVKLTVKGSMLVFSGIKISEAKDLCPLYSKNHFIMRKEEREKEWSAFVFRRI
ncbi:MAG: 50S ribosomal protein L11 methyltransferase [Proteobacteria bacterium]|nr:50S ribosomal protein L11 methyltransferase [Pseudomonadota bacterium]